MKDDPPARRDLAVVGLERNGVGGLDAVRIHATHLQAERCEAQLIDAEALEQRALALSGERTRRPHDDDR